MFKKIFLLFIFITGALCTENFAQKAPKKTPPKSTQTSPKKNAPKTPAKSPGKELPKDTPKTPAKTPDESPQNKPEDKPEEKSQKSKKKEENMKLATFDDGTKIVYEIKMDNPANLPTKYIGGNMFLGGFMGSFGAFGAGISAKYFLNDKLNFEMNLYKSFLSLTERSTGLLSNNNDKKITEPFMAETVVSYNLTSASKKKERRIALKTVATGYKSSTIYTVKDECTMNTFLSARGGLIFFSGGYNRDGLSPVTLKNETGNEYDKPYFGDMYSTSVFTGLNFGRTSFFVLDFPEEKNITKVALRSNIYFDLIVNVSSNINFYRDSTLLNDSSKEIEENIEHGKADGAVKKLLGFRLGFETIQHPGDHFSGGSKFEIGTIPTYTFTDLSVFRATYFSYSYFFFFNAY